MRYDRWHEKVWVTRSMLVSNSESSCRAFKWRHTSETLPGMDVVADAGECSGAVPSGLVHNTVLVHAFKLKAWMSHPSEFGKSP